MSMLHDMAVGDSIHYKSELTYPLLRSLTRRWHRKRTRQAAFEALHEVTMLRTRLSQATIECSEWRLKVGGAAYQKYGPQFMDEVETGIRNRIDGYLHITDEDLYPGDVT